jgi:hypothetical protein
MFAPFETLITPRRRNGNFYKGEARYTRRDTHALVFGSLVFRIKSKVNYGQTV